MVARSSDLMDGSAPQQTPEALAAFFPHLPRFTPFVSLSGLALLEPNRLAAAMCGVRSPVPNDSVEAVTGGERIKEAIPALGRFAKRVLDLLVASIAMLLFWPWMLVIAVAVRLGSRGPIIYPSWRVGKNGIPFPCYKFRTMVHGANGLREALRHLNQWCGPFFKIANDPRVTPLGRFLRKYSLDELPQLWNVLRGDMSLVGPRPHRIEDVEHYRPGHEQRLEVKPGMTGLWQVTARANPSFDLCMLLDLGYIRYWSLLLDCKILLQTIPAVLAGEGQ